MWDVSQLGPDAHQIRFTGNYQEPGWERWLLLTGDRHWDNRHSDHALQKKHLELAKERNAPVIDVGDFFCLMQGKYDKRKSADAVRPEHLGDNYFDAVPDTAVDFFRPYAHQFAVIGHGNHECYDDITEVLTDSGWKLFKDLDGSEDIATMNLGAGNIEWQHPSHYGMWRYEGKMHLFQSRAVDYCVTPDHKIIYKPQHIDEYRERKSYDFPYSSGAGMKFPVAAGSGNDDFPIDDDLLRICAWVYTDGSVRHHGKKRCAIFQSKDISGITEILDRLGAQYNIQTRLRERRDICGKELKSDPLPAKTIYVNGSVRNDILSVIKDKKRLNMGLIQSLSDRQFGVFLSSFIDGDGTRNAISPSSMAAYGERAILEDLQIACITHGYRCSISEYRDGQFRLNITKGRDRWVRGAGNYFSEVDYNGYVYCLTLPNGNMIVRRNGKPVVSGNTSIIKHHQTDVLARFAYRLNAETGSNVQVGGYGGYVKLSFVLPGEKKRKSLWVRYHHGDGGGGPVTKGVIGTNRRGVTYANADIVVTGHIHERWRVEIVKEYMTDYGTLQLKPQVHLCVSTYKQEHKIGGGWHIERGAPPKPLGGTWLRFEWDAAKQQIVFQDMPTL